MLLQFFPTSRMHFFALILAFAAFALADDEITKEEGVLVLTTKNFESAIKVRTNASNGKDMTWFKLPLRSFLLPL